MAGKKKRGNRPAAKVDNIAIAARELSKGNTKIAVKHARVAHRLDPSAPTTSLLSRALLHRTQDLYARKMHEPARAILAELNAMAVDDACDVAELRRFNVLLGVGNARANADMLTSDPALLGQLIDTAVRDGDTTPCPSELVPAVRKVRQALDAVAAAQDEQGVEMLQDIGRSSPLADWKLFVRGLIAFYGSDADRRDANWSRLDADRLAFRVARSLVPVTTAPNAQSGDQAIDPHRLQSVRHALDAPLARQLRQLQTALQAGTRWTSIFGSLKREFAKSHPEVLERVSAILVSKFISECDYDEFERFRKLNPPLRLDPQMSRATALFHERDDDIDSAMAEWRRYLGDIANCERLNESQRNTAIALVYLRLARLAAAEARELHEAGHPLGSPWSDESVDDEVASYLEAADGHFTNSRKYDSGLQAAYAEHCRMLDDWDQTERASRLYEGFAARFPDDFGVQVRAAHHFRRNADDPQKAQEYTRQAETLRPRDPEVAQLCWDCGFDMARQAAKQKQFGLARSELDQAEPYVGQGRELYVLQAMRAAVALKSGNVSEADRWQAEAGSPADFAPAATLAYCADAFQCGVGHRIRGELNAQLKAATSARPNPIAAAAMARFLNSLRSADVTYQGSTGHEKLVVAYLTKCPKKGWTEAGLTDAVRFAATHETPDLLKRLAQLGCKRFPSNPHFPAGMGQYEMSRGPRRCNRPRAIRHFEESIELNREAESYPLDRETLETVSRGLTMLEMPPREPIFRGDRLPPDVDLEEMLNFVDVPPELQEMMDTLGVSLSDMIESSMSGEHPDDFFKRQRGETRRN